MASGMAKETGDDLFGHPRGLYVLFFTEMWERFSFYGMKALLIFYLTRHFLFSDAESVAIFGAYFGLVYAAPVIGGAIADRYLGFRRAVAFGAVLLTLGHFGMAFEGDGAREVAAAEGVSVARDAVFEQILYLSLALLICGVGFLKACISSIVGQLYRPGDRRRDSGFTLFYMGINLGALLGALICGYLGETLGWAYGFGVAGFGMLIGLGVFTWGAKHLKGAGEPPDPAALKSRVLGPLTREGLIYLASAFGVVLVWQIVQHSHLVRGVLFGALGVVAVAVIAFAFLKCDREERDRLLVVLALTVFSVFFWSLFEQAGSSMNLFADRAVDRRLFGVDVPAASLQSINPVFIVLLAPLFAAGWTALSRSGLDPSAPAKFGLGIIQAGLGFLALAWGIASASEDGSVAFSWLVLAYLLHTTGELCLSPVGLSTVTKLSVPRIVGFMMGGWFLAMGFANNVAAIFAGLASAETAGGVVLDKQAALEGYYDLFFALGLVACAAGGAVLLVAPLLRRGMHGVH